MQYPALSNVNAANSQGKKRSFRSRDAHSLQNLRLVQICQRSRSNLAPHCEQKFGLYTALPQESWAMSGSALPPELTPSAVAMPRRQKPDYYWAAPF
jgi:hypothetical protein